jgi:uncharacterized protein YdhG (YjbR/CyaY superfamily)
MTQVIPIDTLAYAKRLIQAGMPQQQAEVQAQVLKEIIDNNLATKKDIAEVKAEIEKVRAELKADIERVKADLEKAKVELKADIERVRAELKVDIAKVKADIIKWIMGMLIAQSAVIVGLLQILK